MILKQSIDLFGNLITEEIPSYKLGLSKKQLRKIERAKQLKLGQANYFYKTTGKNVFHCDGFVNGVNGQATSGGWTVFKNGKKLYVINAENRSGFTNNEAELCGVHDALVSADKGDEVVTDSMNALAWIRSGRPKARPDLMQIAHGAKNLLHSKQINLYWASRDENQAGNYNEFEK